MIERSRATETSWVDPDDAPELTDEDFARGVAMHGDKVVRRGRPRLDRPKEQVTLRLDAHVLDYFRHDGPGWQTRINDALAKVAAAGRRRAQDRVIAAARGSEATSMAKKPAAGSTPTRRGARRA